LAGEQNTNEKFSETSLRFSRENIQLRRGKVLELTAQGYSAVKIAEMLGVSRALIGLDLQYLREQAKDNIRLYIDEKIPSEYEKCFVGITQILNEAWVMSKETKDNRLKLQALSLANDCYSRIEALLTSVGAVNCAMKFVQDIKKSRSQAAATQIQEEEEIQETTVF
jgi:predicted transcriptional regulator